MVDRGLLSASDAEDLIKQAEHDADIARARNFALKTASIGDANSTASALPPPARRGRCDEAAIRHRRGLGARFVGVGV